MTTIKIAENKPFYCHMRKAEFDAGKIIGMITVEQCKKNECGQFETYEKGHLACKHDNEEATVI